MTLSRPVLGILAACLLLGAPSVGFGQGQSELALVDSIPDDQKLEFATLALKEIRTNVTEVSRMLETAEKEKDIIRIQCLGKKLTTMRALLEVSESALTALQSAIKNAEKARAAMEYRKIYISLMKVRQFRAEADACAGGASKQGATDVEVIDAGLQYDLDDTEGFDPDVDVWPPEGEISRFE